MSSKVKSNKQINMLHNEHHFLQLNNETYLKRNLMLLQISEMSFSKQTKLTLQQQLFPKNLINSNSTKQFFFIAYFCLQKLCNATDLSAISMWYPPRTVNQQIQFKNILFKIIQNLQISGILPKNTVLSKASIIGDISSQVTVSFLRFISQIALRQKFIEKYSKSQKLIQIKLNQNCAQQNNINRFYVYPFVPHAGNNTNIDSSIDLDTVEETYSYYIKYYVKRLLNLRSKQMNPVLAQQFQQAIKQYLQHKKMNQQLLQRMPKATLLQNRAFDRRRIMDRNQQIWKQIQSFDPYFIDQKSAPVLKIDGEVDQYLKNWQPIKGISNIIEANSLIKQIPNTKKQLQQQIVRFKELSMKISKIIKQIPT